ncbi:MAG: glycosyltransferase family 2 protein [Gammaproteobacteria bacterium]
MSREKPVLAIVVPCFDESCLINDVMEQLLHKLNDLKGKGFIDEQSFLYFVDDGSQDETWRKIEDKHGSDPTVKGARLSRNYGHQNALLAGLLSVSEDADCAISIDADLQQDIEAIPEFIDKYRAGAEIVFGVRRDRNVDSRFKKWTANIFYTLIHLLGANTIRNHADYRLVGKKALVALSSYTEFNIFLRGIFPNMGFATDQVFFDVRKRGGGQSKYTFLKMLSFAVNGITSYSVAPLRLISLLGITTFIAALFMSGYILFQAFIIKQTVPGWASTVLPVYVIGGIQLFCIGVVGEYVGKIYGETKSRPRYIKTQELT